VRAAAALVVTALLAFQPATIGQGRPPKLLVLIVVDQMRADFVDRFEPQWSGGLKRLVTQGAWFRNAAYPYLTTVTCAGHATIATGDFPHVHGIVQNAWWDRDAGAQRTCTEDHAAKPIGYNARATEGHSASQLQRPTLTDVLRTQHGARVVALSLKARAAIMLAGHGAEAATWLSESLDGWATASAFSEGPVPAVKRFIDANPIAGDFGKTWDRLLPPARYPEPDDATGENPPRGWTRSFPHALTGTTNQRDAAFATQWEGSPFADDYLGRFAAALVDTLSLGARTDGKVDVLAISFSTPDIVGHAFGPRSQEVHDVYLRLDRTIGALFDRLDAAVGRGQWVAALSSDHGSTPIAEQLLAEGKEGGRLDSKAIAAVVEDRLRTLGKGQHVAQSYYNDIYFAPGVFETMRSTPALMTSVVHALSAMPGVARVFRSDEIRDPAAATDSLQRAAALTYFPGRSGDLMIAAKPGWEFTGAGASHGSASEDDRRVPLLFYGPGIKPGKYEEAVTPADLAPTIAALLGVTMPQTEGRALTAAIEPPHTR
jgi:predicted AlkP superfamily pyrophosphatase or phosphodiesterase